MIAPLRLCALSCFGLILIGCDQEIPPQTPHPSYVAPVTPIATPPAPPEVTPIPQTLILWEQQKQHLVQANELVIQLENAVAQLLQEPNQERLIQSQQHWQTLAIAIEKLALMQALCQQLDYPAGHKASRLFRRIHFGAAHLGYLDADGVHGKTGLIYDIDTPIDNQSLAQQHQLTSYSDATLGVSALGALLRGANGERQAQDFVAAAELNEVELLNGYIHAAELPQNRRRALLELQMQTLKSDLISLHKQWQKRDRQSLINAFSQLDANQQKRHYLEAVKTILTRQIASLEALLGQDSADVTAAFDQRQRDLQRLRWQTQLQSLSEWATIAELGWIKEESDALTRLLDDSNSIATLATQTASSADSQSEQDTASATASPPTTETLTEQHNDTVEHQHAQGDIQTSPTPEVQTPLQIALLAFITAIDNHLTPQPATGAATPEDAKTSESSSSPSAPPIESAAIPNG